MKMTPASIHTPPYGIKSAIPAKSDDTCAANDPNMVPWLKEYGRDRLSTYGETFVDDTATESTTVTVHDRPRFRTQLMTLRYIYGHAVSNPVCQYAHIFFLFVDVGAENLPK